MRKLRLDPETLRVESFAPDPRDPERRGTVRAQRDTVDVVVATAAVVPTCEAVTGCALGCQTQPMSAHDDPNDTVRIADTI
jgi:hypothetical protein